MVRGIDEKHNTGNSVFFDSANDSELSGSRRDLSFRTKAVLT